MLLRGQSSHNVYICITAVWKVTSVTTSYKYISFTSFLLATSPRYVCDHPHPRGPWHNGESPRWWTSGSHRCLFAHLGTGCGYLHFDVHTWCECSLPWCSIFIYLGRKLCWRMFVRHPGGPMLKEWRGRGSLCAHPPETNVPKHLPRSLLDHHRVLMRWRQGK